MSYNFKSIADVDVVKTPADNANILIEENGIIKKVSAKEKLDLDIEVVASYYSIEDEGSGYNLEYIVKSINTFNNIKNKVFGTSVPKCTAKISSQPWGNAESPYAIEFVDGYVTYFPENYMEDGSPEFIQFAFWGNNVGCYAVLTSDDVFQGVFLD